MIDINKTISEGNIKFIDIKYTDLAGIMRHVTLPVSYIEKAIKNTYIYRKYI
jgi:glutamine synthetase